MAVGTITIVATGTTTPPVTSGSTNVIPLNYYDPVALRTLEFAGRGGASGSVKSSVGLTWRDFTIDCTPFDYKYKLLIGVEIVEYGKTENFDLSREVADNSKPLLFKNWANTPYSVGDVIDYTYKPNNIFDVTQPAKIRQSDDPNVLAHLNTNNSYPIDTERSSVYYIKTKNIYSDGTKSSINILYSYRAEFGYVDSHYKPGLKYKQNLPGPNGTLLPLELPLLSKGVEILTSSKVIEMFSFSYENFSYPWNNPQELDFSSVIWQSDIRDLLSNMYPLLNDFNEGGFPMKITFWDTNYGNNPQSSKSRVIVNGAPIENGMGVPFSFFDEGKVSFITEGLNPSDKYTVFFSVMDVVTGYVRLNGNT